MTSPVAISESSSRPLGRWFVGIWLGLSIVLTPLAVFVLGPHIPPGNGSVEAASQVTDNQVLVGIMTPVAVFVLVFLAFAVTTFRNRTAEIVEGPAVRANPRLQLTWVVITTVLVLFLAAFGSFELVDAYGSGGGQGPSAAFAPSNTSQALDVQVIGQQWEFTYRYPSANGLETPHLVLPANRLIRLHVTSLDAIHSFWAYQLGVKADANPGEDNIVYLNTKGPRTFDIRCAELCGLWHGYMFDTGRVVDDNQFASWVKKQQAIFAPVQKYLPPYATTYYPDPQRRAG